MSTANALEELIADLKQMGPYTTRDQYRAKGKFGERVWKEFYATFADFRKTVFTTEKVDIKEVKTEPETSEFKDNTWTISLPKTDIHTLDQLLEYCQVDKEVWTVDRFICNKWAVGAKDAEGNLQVTPLFQVKATLVRRENIIAIREEIEDLKNEAKAVARIPRPAIRSTRQSGNLYQIMIPDLHAGKLSWSKETGYQDYDTHIAVETYRRAIDTLLDRAKGYQIDHVLLGIGQDLLQSDNIQGTTTKGTKVDTDTRYHRTYKVVRKMLVEMIEKLRLIAPVTVKVIPGNHDALSTFTMGDSLECTFEHYTDVFIDNEPINHKFFAWGDVFLMFIHGDKGKQSDYGMWMATEKPKEFGNSKYREVHTGHRHRSAVDEKFGVRVRTMSALCPPDAWHAEQGFVGNLRVAEGLLWNKEAGLTAQFYHTELD